MLHLGGASDVKEARYRLVGPTTEKKRLCIGAERANGPPNRRGQRNRRTSMYGCLDQCLHQDTSDYFLVIYLFCIKRENTRPVMQ